MSFFTIFHSVEDYHPELFEGLYSEKPLPIKVKKDNEVVTYDMPYHNPEFVTNRIERDPKIEEFFTNDFIDKGILKIGKTGNAETQLINCKDLFDRAVELAKQGKTIYKV